MDENSIASLRKLRRLSLGEAQKEFPDFVMPSTTWNELDAEGLKMTLIPLSLTVLYERDEGKRNALVGLLNSISKAENESQEAGAQRSEFFEKYGVDNETYFDEDSTLPPAEKLSLALFGRKQRPRFHFEMEALAKFLDEESAAQFREAVGR